MDLIRVGTLIAVIGKQEKVEELLLQVYRCCDGPGSACKSRLKYNSGCVTQYNCCGSTSGCKQKYTCCSMLHGATGRKQKYSCCGNTECTLALVV